MAAASRRDSLWVSFANTWICCACRARSAAATCSRFTPNDDWLAITARITAPVAPTPQDAEPPQRAAVELVLVGQQVAQHATGVIRLEVCEMVWFLGQAPLALLKARRITQETLTGNVPLTLIQTFSGRRIGFISGGKQLKTARPSALAAKE